MFPTNATNIAYILTSRFTSFRAFQSLIGFIVSIITVLLSYWGVKHVKLVKSSDLTKKIIEA